MSNRNSKRYRAFLSLALVAVCAVICSIAGKKTYNYVAKKQDAKAGARESFSDVNGGERRVWPSGETVGIYVKTDGVMVVGITPFQSANGCKVSPAQGKIVVGDYICKINGEGIKNKKDFVERLNSIDSDEVCISILRQGKNVDVNVDVIKDSEGNRKIGVWIKDDLAGIGTITCIDGNDFLALGHSINDNDTGKIIQMKEGCIYGAKVVRILKAHDKVPGRIEGVIDYSSNNIVGTVALNESYGIAGELLNGIDSKAKEDELVPIGKKEDINLGQAYIVSSVSGKREYYSIEIESIERNSKEKEMKIKVTDPKLLAITDGIVQGMSGSPILQNGKLIGAVTHVFVDDPTRGYGIFIEDMMNEL